MEVFVIADEMLQMIPSGIPTETSLEVFLVIRPFLQGFSLKLLQFDYKKKIHYSFLRIFPEISVHFLRNASWTHGKISPWNPPGIFLDISP